MVKQQRILPAVAAIPGLIYGVVALLVIAAMACKVATRFSFNVNEGWNAYWATAAWSGADLYPPPGGLKLNNYLPLWFYLTGAVGAVVGDSVRAGRAIAAAALLLDGVVIALIAREIVGRHKGREKGGWLAGVAFLALFGIFHQDYAAADDPQMLASLFMLIALWRVVRTADAAPPATFWLGIVLLMLVAGLTKHNIVAAPLSIALFLLLIGRVRALAWFLGLSGVAVAAAGAGLYAAYGQGMFRLLLLARPYNAGVAWSQSMDQFGQYGLLLAVIPFLALRADAKARLVLIYALVSLVLGVAMSGVDGVDVNVFFDLLFCIAIGLGVMGARVAQYVHEDDASLRLRWAAVAGFMAIALAPPLLAIASAREGITDAFAAITDKRYAADVAYIRSIAPGPVICRDPTLCYWAGAPFNVDLNNIRGMAFADPALEGMLVTRIERCEFALIQLNDDWTDPVNGPLTNRVRAAIKSHYQQVRESKYGRYWRPRCN
jgi:hypothetical protein